MDISLQTAEILDQILEIMVDISLQTAEILDQILNNNITTK